MSVDWAALSAVGVSVATAGGTIYTARAGRRTKGQERRDDFTTVTTSMREEISRLGKRVDDQEQDLAEQQVRITGQEVAIRYLAGWTRSLVGFVRLSGMEPPPAPQPVPDDVRPYLTDLV